MWKITQGQRQSWGSLSDLWEGLLDLVYPPCCQVCHAAGPLLCDGCVAGFVPIPLPVCSVCGRPSGMADGETAKMGTVNPCRNCAAAELRGGWGFGVARAGGIYQGGLRHAIHRLKYSRVEALGVLLGEYLAVRCTTEGLLDGLPIPDRVIPVPIHPARERERGFNQAALLAAPVADAFGVPMDTRVLKRVRRSKPQVGLTVKARRSNMTVETFAVDRDKNEAIQGKNILLVDDVFTTGATVGACARCLTNAGAATVTVVTLAGGG